MPRRAQSTEELEQPFKDWLEESPPVEVEKPEPEPPPEPEGESPGDIIPAEPTPEPEAPDAGAPLAEAQLPEMQGPEFDEDEEPFAVGEPSVLDFLDHAEGGRDGIVANPGLARESPCIAYELGARKLVFSKGIVGALSPEQQDEFCAETEPRALSEAQRARLEAFTTAAHECDAEIADKPKGERLSPYLQCMSAELEVRGIRL